jgi:hypothetical protein
MKSQERRDGDAITIFAGLLLSAMTAAAGAVLLVVADHLVDLHGTVLDTLACGALVCAVAAAVGYIYRHRRD